MSDALNREIDINLAPTKTPESNSVLKGPPGTDIGDLHCFVGDDGYGAVVTISIWDLTAEQRERIAAGANIRMLVWQHPIPPLGLTIEAPFCNCDTEMRYDSAESVFVCPSCGERVKHGSFEANDQLPSPASDRDVGYEQAQHDFTPDQSEPDDPQAA